MKITKAAKSLLVLGIIMATLLVLAGPASALQEEPAAPAPPILALWAILISVGIALLAVVVMALVWRRDQAY